MVSLDATRSHEQIVGVAYSNGVFWASTALTSCLVRLASRPMRSCRRFQVRSTPRKRTQLISNSLEFGDVHQIRPIAMLKFLNLVCVTEALPLPYSERRFVLSECFWFQNCVCFQKSSFSSSHAIFFSFIYFTAVSCFSFFFYYFQSYFS